MTAVDERSFNSEYLLKAWLTLNEYDDFRHLARYRKKLEQQLRDANIPLTHVPWKTMMRTLLCRNLFSSEQLTEMNVVNTGDCCTEADLASSETVMKLILEDDDDMEECNQSSSEVWYELEQLKQCFQVAVDILPTSRHARKEMLHRILGYPTGYTEVDTAPENEDEPVDLTRVFSADDQHKMHTGDLIELSGNRLSDAFYVYRLPQKGIWAQIQHMWSNHEVTDFVFTDTEHSFEQEGEVVLVPAMDEYGYGIPYLFATRPAELLSEGALYKYVDINCPQVARQTQNSTIALVQQHLNERLKNSRYFDKYMNEEMIVEIHRFPQEYVAIVNVNDGPKDNVLWTRRAHHDDKQAAVDLNDNPAIFFSRRILEAEEQLHRIKN